MVFSSLKQFSLKLNIVLQNFVVSRVGLFFQYLKLISYCVRFPKVGMTTLKLLGQDYLEAIIRRLFDYHLFDIHKTQLSSGRLAG